MILHGSKIRDGQDIDYGVIPYLRYVSLGLFLPGIYPAS
jgi:hypothetical protein